MDKSEGTQQLTNAIVNQVVKIYYSKINLGIIMKKQILTISIFFAVIGIFSLPSCYYDVEAELYPDTGTPTCDTTTAKFGAFVSPLMVSKCATSGCHNTTTASAGVNLDGYTNIKNFMSKNQPLFFGSINHRSGFSAMPKGGAKLSSCEINKLQVWVNAGLLNN